MIIGLFNFAEDFDANKNGERNGNVSKRERGAVLTPRVINNRPAKGKNAIEEEEGEEEVIEGLGKERLKYNRLNDSHESDENAEDDGDDWDEEEKRLEHEMLALKNAERLKLVKSLTLLADSVKWHSSNKHRWRGNLGARRCSDSIEILVMFCSTFLDFYSLLIRVGRSEEYDGEEHSRDAIDAEEGSLECSSNNSQINSYYGNTYSNSLKRLKFEYENTEIKLSQYLARSSDFYAANLSVKNILYYPGCTYVPSKSVSICSALGAISPLADDDFYYEKVKSIRSWTSIPKANFYNLDLMNYPPPSMMRMNCSNTNKYDNKMNVNERSSSNCNYKNRGNCFENGYNINNCNYSNNDNNNNNNKSGSDEIGVWGEKSFFSTEACLGYKRMMMRRSLSKSDTSDRRTETNRKTRKDIGKYSCLESDPGSGIGTGSRSGYHWWWNIAAACDWPLLSHLIPEAALIEEDSGLSLLLLTCMRNGAGLGIVRDFVRYAFVIG